jgi:hypothetical protein
MYSGLDYLKANFLNAYNKISLYIKKRHIIKNAFIKALTSSIFNPNRFTTLKPKYPSLTHEFD